MHADLKPKAVLFDFYRTLLDIWTNEKDIYLWDKLSLFLRYRGILCDGYNLRRSYESLVQCHIEQSSELYPDISVVDIFNTILTSTGVPFSHEFLLDCVQLFRSLSIRHLDLFPDTLSTLHALRRDYTLGLVTDAQRVFLDPELRMTGLSNFFDVVIISSDHLFHKPDPRMFFMAIEQLKLSADQVLYVGDSLHRDIVGADLAGIRSVLVHRDDNESFSDYPTPDKVVHSLCELCSSGFL